MEWVAVALGLLGQLVISAVGVGIAAGKGSARLKAVEDQAKSLKRDLETVGQREERCRSDLHDRVTEVATGLARVQGRLNGQGGGA